MQEVKLTVTQFFYIMAAIAVLALAMVASGIRDDIVSLIEDQEIADENMKEYALYAAYDDSTIRGQEMVNLIMTTKGDPFVIIMDSSYNVVLSSVDDVTKDMTIDVTQAMNTSSIPELNDAQAHLGNELVTSNSITSVADAYLLHNNSTLISSSDIQTWFLNCGSGNYLSYSTSLIYESKTSTHIIGILAVARH